MVEAVIAYTKHDHTKCAQHVAHITARLRPLLNAYYDRVHDEVISRSIWLPHVQGFFAWGAGSLDKKSGTWIKFDGLSGNQVLLFQALDAFLGLEPYLSQQDKHRNVPKQQRMFCEILEKHAFRNQLKELSASRELSVAEARILREFEDIIKRLRVRPFE